MSVELPHNRPQPLDKMLAALTRTEPFLASPASGEEADDHAVRKFMKDVKDAMKDTSKSCIWWGDS